MNFHLRNKLCTLFSIWLLCLQVRADGTGSIFFLDSPVHQFLRSRSSDVVAQTDSMLLPEVGAAVSVLLGFSPPASLSADSSSKLNEILVPNPFDRPRAVLMMEVKGTEYLLQGLDNTQFGSALSRKIVLDSNKANIQLPDENEVSVVSLDEPVGPESDEADTDKELHYLASWLGGSYVTNDVEQLSGELIAPLASGTSLNLHMSKKADKDFALGIASLIRNVRRAIEVHEDFVGQNPAELITGCFSGIKALEGEYGSKGITLQGMELFLTTLSKLVDSLQDVYKGQIVGVIFFDGTPYPESRSLFNVKFMSQPSMRLLEELRSSPNFTTIAEVELVRRSLAWITGIILLISTLLGIYFLLYMPITKDTLLYSNVKLD